MMFRWICLRLTQINGDSGSSVREEDFSESQLSVGTKIVTREGDEKSEGGFGCFSNFKWDELLEF